ncbi:Hsp20/alpha crystallin family protein [Haloarcula pelagica]|uniref:Hsp20/alpha crystallin family protein n=1 Tax=Haloarcula pelagica TaxID=3033389 RepID=UPI0024C471A3|nr:Hsp20/alpha crystallin family protein [Halomicroarcula sp. YJ-61-S]
MPAQPSPTPERIDGRTQRAAGRPVPFPVDVEDHGGEFVVSADLPGLRKQDIDISVRKDRLRIVADFGDDDAGPYRRRERRRGEHQRVIRLPDRVDEARVAGAYVDGVLQVTLRKRERPRRVDIE